MAIILVKAHFNAVLNQATPRGLSTSRCSIPFPMSKSNTAIRMMAAAFVLTPSATAITESAFDPPPRQLVPALLVNFCW
jgi:hypothetical protein